MSEHTKGPWRWVDKVGWSGLETPDGEDLLLYAVCDDKWHGRVVTDNPADKPLLAAAPLGYELAEAILKWADPSAIPTHLRAMAAEFMAKAEGRS
jgi:hypothetical protein